MATKRTAEVYAEIAPSITAFGLMLGRAFGGKSTTATMRAPPLIDGGG